MRTIGFLCLLVIALTPNLGYSQKATFRKGTADSSFVIKYQASNGIQYPEGSSVDFGSDYGWGLRVGYNHTSKFNASFQFDWASVPYTALLQPADDSSTVQTIRHKSDQWSGMAKGTYHFSTGRLTPYIEGGVGWVTIDSNIASGESSSGCWWLPWGPVVCDTWQYSYTDSSFAYELGVGLRFEPNPRTFVRGSIARKWVDTDFASTTPDYYTAQIEIGAMVWD